MYYYVRASLMVMTRVVFFFNDTATTEIYTLSLHDALPISPAFPRTSRLKKTLSPESSEFQRIEYSGPSTSAESRSPDRKSTRLNSSHANISYAVFCLKKNKILYHLMHSC